jgi:hypothetical protein
MMQGPKRVVSVLLGLIVLSAGFLDYWSYSQTFYREPGVWMDVVSGTARAPGQYRIGVVDTAYFLARHTHLGLRHALASVDVIAGLIAVFTLFLVLRRSPVYRRASQAAEWFGAASFVVLVQFYLAWLLWYQKPETLPTAAMLSLGLLLLTVRVHANGARKEGTEQISPAISGRETVAAPGYRHSSPVDTSSTSAKTGFPPPPPPQPGLYRLEPARQRKSPSRGCQAYQENPLTLTLAPLTVELAMQHFLPVAEDARMKR